MKNPAEPVTSALILSTEILELRREWLGYLVAFVVHAQDAQKEAH
jgi:hypothetical protein